MKLGMLLNENFHVAIRRLNEQQLPLKAAFILKGISSKVQEELVKYEETRKEALTKYGSKDDSGELIVDADGQVELTLEQRQHFIKELNQLIDLDINIGTISVDALGDAKLSVEDLNALDGLIN